MHKKPLVAVLLFGLLLILPLGVTEARVDPGNNLVPQGQLLPMIARGLVKGPANTPTPVAEAPTNITAGVSRTGATFCDAQWQGGIAYFVGGWFYGDEIYATYQDPEELGTCAGLDGIYTFDVTAMYWVLYNPTQDPGPFHIQPLVYEDAGDVICPTPGNLSCASDLFELNFPAANVVGVYLPYTTECCQFGPYFVGAYFADFIGSGIIEVITDANPIVPCYTYNDWGGGFKHLEDYGWTENLSLSSEGNAYDQNNCPGLPGVCDFQAWYDDVTYYWQAPDGNLANDYFTRYTADVSCTLMSFRFAVYCPAELGTTPTYRVSVFGPNGPLFGGRMYPQAFGVPLDPLDPNYIVGFEILHDDIVCFPGWNEIDLTSYNLEFGPGQDMVVAVGLSDNTPDPVNDVAAFLSDDGGSPTGRSGFYAGVISDWVYMDEVFNGDYDMVFEAYICCEVVEAEEVACDSPGPDDWNTFAHDYNRTSATTIEVGDPCQINPVWIADLPQNVNFTQATVADERVYISSDQRSRVYDLTALPRCPGRRCRCGTSR